MVESFGGSLNLIIWIIATLGAGYYSYRCLFGTRGMIDQYGAGDGAAFPLVLIGTFAGAGFIMGIVILISACSKECFLTKLDSNGSSASAANFTA